MPRPEMHISSGLCERRLHICLGFSLEQVESQDSFDVVLLETALAR